MSRFKLSKVIFALLIIVCIQASNEKRKAVSKRKSVQSPTGKELSQGFAKNGVTKSKSRLLKQKLRAKQKEQNLLSKGDKKKIYKRKGKRRGRKASWRLKQKKKITKKKKRKVAAKSSRSAPIVGDICQFVDFFGARRMGVGCEDGSKVVITQRWVPTKDLHHLETSSQVRRQEAVPNCWRPHNLWVCCKARGEIQELFLCHWENQLSSVQGDPSQDGGLTFTFYWRRHLRDSQRFLLKVQWKAEEREEGSWRPLRANGSTWRKCERRGAAAWMGPSLLCQRIEGWAVEQYIHLCKQSSM